MFGKALARQDVATFRQMFILLAPGRKTAPHSADRPVTLPPRVPACTLDYYQPTAKQWEDDLNDLRVRLLSSLGLLSVVTAIGTIGFHYFDPSAGWVRAFFMTAITLTTVGYGHEVRLDSNGALVFTAALILVGMGCVLYFVSTGTAFVLEGQLGHVFRRRRMQRELADLAGHLIVCGSGATALYAASELKSVEREVVLVVESEDAAATARAQVSDVPIVLGDPTDDDVLIAAGAERAIGMVACTDSDNENVVVTLTARQINPNLRIVSRVQDIDHEAKIRKVGADAVVSPNFIGGLRLASELIRPTVVTFLDTMLRDQDLNLRIDEIGVPSDSPAVGKPLNALGLEKMPQILLLATRTPDERWQYNPLRTELVTADMVLIFLGAPNDARALSRQLGGVMLSPTPKEV